MTNLVNNSRVVAVVLALLMVGSMVALPGLAIDMSETSTAVSVQSSADIDENLLDGNGETEIVLALEEIPDLSSQEDPVMTLQSHADETQDSVLEELEHMDDVTVENTWWITNAVMVTADLDHVGLRDLADIDGVDALHPVTEYETPEPADPRAEQDAGLLSASNATYGLDLINATDVWETFDYRGEDTRVVVADTGVDENHSDIELAAEDGWNDFTDDDRQDPIDEHGHGTHVAGTIAGGNASGTAIGVAPETDLASARICDPGCSEDAMLGAIEWAVVTDSDIISLSVGGPLDGSLAEAVYNSMDVGTFVVGSIGNDGEGSVDSPGAGYDIIGIGAVDENRDVLGLSGGAHLDEDDYGEDWMDHWPDGGFIAPDVVAPGEQVFSACAEDVGYCNGSHYTKTGTSHSTPHVSGTAALVAGSGDVSDSWELADILRETAAKPADWDPTDAAHYDDETERDSRYGVGIIDAYDAVSVASLESGIEGTVTDEAADPIEGAEVSTDSGSVLTDETGDYSILEHPGTHNVTATAYGYVEETETVDIEDDEDVVTQDFSLEASLDGFVDAPQPDGIEGGEWVNATIDVIHADELVVNASGSYEGNTSLRVDGSPESFGDTVTIEDGAVQIGVKTEEATSGNITLEHHVSGSGESITLLSGTTTVYEEHTPVGIVDDDGSYGDDIAADVSAELPEDYRLDVIGSDEVGTKDSYVVQHLDDGAAASFINQTSDETGVVYLDQWGDEANGVSAYSSVTGDPETTDEEWEISTPVTYTVASEHQLIEGYEQNDSIPIHDANGGDHTWFENTTFDVLATVGNEDETSGPGLAVDEETNTVLAASSGYSDYVGSDEFELSAIELLSDSVTYVTETEEETDGYVAVGNATGESNETVNVTVDTNLENVHGYEIELSYDGEVASFEDATGVDLPVDAANASDGTLQFTGAATNGTDEPTIAELEFELVGSVDESTDLLLNGGVSALNDDETYLDVEEWIDGDLSIITECDTPGGLGDVRGDGMVGSLDATWTLMHIAGLEPGEDVEDYKFHEACADLTGDGEVTSADVTYIQQIIVGDAPQPEA